MRMTQSTSLTALSPGTIASPAPESATFATRNVQQACRPIWPLSDLKIIHIMRNGAFEEIIC